MSSTYPRILVIEDNQDWQKAIMRCQLLRKLHDLDPSTVIVANSYSHAMEHFSLHPFQLAITDVMLKEEGELIYWRNLAHLFQLRNVPIIVISAYLTQELIVETINEFGVVGIFDKHNFNENKLNELILKILSSNRIRFSELYKQILDLNQMVETTDPRSVFPINKESWQRANSITWLHLSDLHCGSPNGSDRKVVIESLMRDLKRCGERSLKPDFIVITGDIAYNGKTKDYILALEFLDLLLESTGISKDRLFLVPGNHDVDWNKIPEAAKESNLIDRRTTQKIWNDKDSRKLHMKRLGGYSAFVRRYFNNQNSIYKKDCCTYCNVFTVNNHRVALIGLNSAWTSGNFRVNDKVKDKGALVVGEGQIREALPEIEGAKIKIAMIHHPLSYLQDFDQKDVKQLLNTNCHFLLHGHLHESEFERVDTLKGKLIVIPSGAVYQGRELVNSYNYVTIDAELKRAWVMFRRFSDRQGEWLKDLDTTGENWDGVIQFELGSGITW